MCYHVLMKHRYSLDSSLEKLYRIKTPLSPFIFPFANTFLSLFSLHSDSRITVNKHESGLLVEPYGADGKLPLIIYIHGGAFVYKAAPYHYRNVREYVTKCGCRVLIADYPLSPKHRYPEAPHYVLSLYKKALDDERNNGIALMGDSAGGEIALSTVMKIIDEKLPKPNFMALIYPVVAQVATESKERYIDTPVWNSRLNGRMWKYYLGDEEYRSVFDYSFLSSFPPLYIEAPQFDALHDEGVMLASRLSSSGVKTVHYDIPLAPHGYDMCLNSDITLLFLERRCEYIKEGFPI